jgi:hypothetical protein
MTMNSGQAAEAMKNGLLVRRPEWDNTLYVFRDAQSRRIMSVSASRGNLRACELQSDDLFATDWYVVNPDDVPALRLQLTDAQTLGLAGGDTYDKDDSQLCDVPFRPSHSFARIHRQFLRPTRLRTRSHR